MQMFSRQGWCIIFAVSLVAACLYGCEQDDTSTEEVILIPPASGDDMMSMGEAGGPPNLDNSGAGGMNEVPPAPGGNMGGEPGEMTPPGPSEGGNGNAGSGNMSGARALGAACQSNDDCDTGLCVTGLPGGYCSNTCSGAGDCGPNGSCWNLGAPEQLCLKNCTEDSQCRGSDGYVCDSDGTCYPGGNSGGGNPGGGNPGGGGATGMGQGPGASVGEVVQDFSLINCGTGQPVSMRDHFSGEKAAMFVLVAGWCGSCEQFVPQVLELVADPRADGLKVAFVLGEDRSRNEATQRYCQQYARQKNVPLENIFLDHDGTNAFRTTFTNMDVYTDAAGRFGLPFTALMNPTTWVYAHADRAGTDINQVLSQLLAQ